MESEHEPEAKLRAAREIHLVVLECRSASRLTGWVSYTLGYNQDRDLTTGTWFNSDTLDSMAPLLLSVGLSVDV